MRLFDGEPKGCQTSVSRVLLDDYGEIHCEMCGRTLICDEFGDMPDACPHCKHKLYYSIFDTHQKTEKDA